MKRGVFDLLRRGFDNAIANWPLLLIRFAEAILIGVIMIVTLLLALVPIIVSLGFKFAELQTPENLEAAMQALVTRWTLLFYIVGVVLFLMLLFVVLHSFVEAGSARVYVDGDRIAGPALQGPKSRYRVFSMSKWWSGAVDGWWAVFWMYNVAWGAAGLILLIPLVPTLAFMLLLRDNPGPMVVIGCLGLLLALMLMIPVAIATAIWTNRAIASWAVRRGGVRDTLRAAWAGFKADFGRHVLLALALFVISFAGSLFIGSLTFFAGFAEILGRDNSDTIAVMMLPVRFLAQILSTAFSSAVAGWFLASFCAIANETT